MTTAILKDLQDKVLSEGATVVLDRSTYILLLEAYERDLVHRQTNPMTSGHGPATCAWEEMSAGPHSRLHHSY